MNIYFLFWVLIQHYLILLLKSTSFSHWNFFQVTPELLWLPAPQQGNLFKFLSTFLLYGPGVSCVFPALALESAISPRSPRLATKIRVLDVPFATRLLFLLGLLNWEKQDKTLYVSCRYVYMHLYTQVYTHMNISTITICVYVRLHKSSYSHLQL